LLQGGEHGVVTTDLGAGRHDERQHFYGNVAIVADISPL
jgi:hypothetical protein